MNKLFLFMLVVLVIPFSLAQTLDVDENVTQGQVIAEIGNPIEFSLEITNYGEVDRVNVYTLVGADITPKEKFDLPKGTITLDFEAKLNDVLLQSPGFKSLDVKVKTQNQGTVSEKVAAEVILLKDVFSIEGNKVFVGDDNAVVSVKNTRKIDLEGVNFKISSEFFEYERKEDFRANEEKTIVIPLDSDNIVDLVSGTYIVEAEIEVNGKTAEISGFLDYEAKESVETVEDQSGTLSKVLEVKKINNGNTPVDVNVILEKNIISRLFTIYSETPESIQRDGFSVFYVWNDNLAPGESFEVKLTTNYTLPVIILLLIVVVIFFYLRYIRTDVSVKKSVSFVKTRGGEFALRVKLNVKARKRLENVVLKDRLPHSTKLYDKFGKRPDEIDEAKRLLTWKIGNISSGEERIFSYIIYSKIQTVGRFALPTAHISFEANGKHKSETSNNAYFIGDNPAESG